MASNSEELVRELGPLSHSQRVQKLVKLGQDSLVDESDLGIVQQLVASSNSHEQHLALLTTLGSRDGSLAFGIWETTKSSNVRARAFDVILQIGSDEQVTKVLLASPRQVTQQILKSLRKKNRVSIIDRVIRSAADTNDHQAEPAALLRSALPFGSEPLVRELWPKVEFQASRTSWGMLACYHAAYAADRLKLAIASENEQHRRARSKLRPEETAEAADVDKQYERWQLNDIDALDAALPSLLLRDKTSALDLFRRIDPGRRRLSSNSGDGFDSGLQQLYSTFPSEVAELLLESHSSSELLTPSQQAAVAGNHKLLMGDYSFCTPLPISSKLNELSAPLLLRCMMAMRLPLRKVLRRLRPQQRQALMAELVAQQQQLTSATAALKPAGRGDHRWVGAPLAKVQSVQMFVVKYNVLRDVIKVVRPINRNTAPRKTRCTRASKTFKGRHRPRPTSGGQPPRPPLRLLSPGAALNVLQHSLGTCCRRVRQWLGGQVKPLLWGKALDAGGWAQLLAAHPQLCWRSRHVVTEVLGSLGTAQQMQVVRAVLQRHSNKVQSQQHPEHVFSDLASFTAILPQADVLAAGKHKAQLASMTVAQRQALHAALQPHQPGKLLAGRLAAEVAAELYSYWRQLCWAQVEVLLSWAAARDGAGGAGGGKFLCQTGVVAKALCPWLVPMPAAHSAPLARTQADREEVLRAKGSAMALLPQAQALLLLQQVLAHHKQLGMDDNKWAAVAAAWRLQPSGRRLELGQQHLCLVLRRPLCRLAPLPEQELVQLWGSWAQAQVAYDHSVAQLAHNVHDLHSNYHIQDLLIEEHQVMEGWQLCDVPPGAREQVYKAIEARWHVGKLELRSSDVPRSQLLQLAREQLALLQRRKDLTGEALLQQQHRWLASLPWPEAAARPEVAELLGSGRALARQQGLAVMAAVAQAQPEHLLQYVELLVKHCREADPMRLVLLGQLLDLVKEEMVTAHCRAAGSALQAPLQALLSAHLAAKDLSRTSQQYWVALLQLLLGEGCAWALQLLAQLLALHGLPGTNTDAVVQHIKAFVKGATAQYTQANQSSIVELCQGLAAMAAAVAPLQQGGQDVCTVLLWTAQAAAALRPPSGPAPAPAALGLEPAAVEGWWAAVYEAVDGALAAALAAAASVVAGKGSGALQWPLVLQALTRLPWRLLEQCLPWLMAQLRPVLLPPAFGQRSEQAKAAAAPVRDAVEECFAKVVFWVRSTRQHQRREGELLLQLLPWVEENGVLPLAAGSALKLLADDFGALRLQEPGGGPGLLARLLQLEPGYAALPQVFLLLCRQHPSQLSPLLALAKLPPHSLFSEADLRLLWRVAARASRLAGGYYRAASRGQGAARRQAEAQGEDCLWAVLPCAWHGSKLSSGQQEQLADTLIATLRSSSTALGMERCRQLMRQLVLLPQLSAAKLLSLLEPAAEGGAAVPQALQALAMEALKKLDDRQQAWGAVVSALHAQSSSTWAVAALGGLCGGLVDSAASWQQLWGQLADLPLGRISVAREVVRALAAAVAKGRWPSEAGGKLEELWQSGSSHRATKVEVAKQCRRLLGCQAAQRVLLAAAGGDDPEAALAAAALPAKVEGQQQAQFVVQLLQVLLGNADRAVRMEAMGLVERQLAAALRLRASTRCTQLVLPLLEQLMATARDSQLRGSAEAKAAQAAAKEVAAAVTYTAGDHVPGGARIPDHDSGFDSEDGSGGGS